MDEDTGKQDTNSSHEWLKPWQFKPGVSGNPSGRPKGTVSLKEFAKKYLRELDDDEKLEFMKGLSKDIIWKMGEGAADTKSDITSGGKALPTPIVNVISKDHGNGEDNKPE